jgi:hypothetical protein
MDAVVRQTALTLTIPCAAEHGCNMYLGGLGLQYQGVLALTSDSGQVFAENALIAKTLRPDLFG